ncbi:MAG: hypothetical protein ACR2PA_13715 [Hyphomicrobiaceae bacterium]
MSNGFSRYPPPTGQDWLLLAISIVFVVMGAIILTNDRDVGIVTLAFFGSCLAVSVGTILRKYRFRRFAAEKVDVTGGVPIRPKTGIAGLVGAWLLVLGLILVTFGHDYPLVFRLIAGFIAVVGVVFLAAALTGQWPGGYLLFDPEHLTIAQRGWRARIPWDEITAVHESEFHSNPVLLVEVADPIRLEITPSAAQERAMKSIAGTQAMMGADFAIMTMHYGIDLPVLAAAVARYVQDATARAELRARLA